MPGSARARSLRLPSAPPSRCWKAWPSTSPGLPRGSSGASGQASASARSSKAARCSTAVRATARCRRCSGVSPSRADGACSSSSIRPRPACMARTRSRPSPHCRTSPKRKPKISPSASCKLRCPRLPPRTSRPSAMRSAICRRRWAPISRRYRADPYVSAGVAAVLKGLAGDGITGLGQSSWGPTGFAFAASEAEGQALLAAARAYAGGARLRFELAQGRNEPANHRGAGAGFLSFHLDRDAFPSRPLW